MDKRNAVYGPMPELRPGLRLPFTSSTLRCCCLRTARDFAFSSRFIISYHVRLAGLAGSRRDHGPSRWLDRRHAVLAGLTVAAVGTSVEPVRFEIFLGQVNLILLGIVARCLTVCCLVPHGRAGSHRHRRSYQAHTIGLRAVLLAAATVADLLDRDSGSFPAASLLGIFLAPIDSREYWLHAALDPSRIGRIGYAGNQSRPGALHRLGLPVSLELALWLGGVTVVVIACLAAVIGSAVKAKTRWLCWVVVATGLLLSRRSRGRTTGSGLNPARSS